MIKNCENTQQELCRRISIKHFAGGRSSYQPEISLTRADILMPEMDGLEATKIIRESLLAQQPIIIAMTANAMAEDREECFKAGMDDYLSKPINMEALVDKLQEAAIKLKSK